MGSDPFASTDIRPGTASLTVFRASLSGHEQTSWEALFGGFTALKGITFSSSIEFLMRLAGRLNDMEIVFGAESILPREHLTLLQASQTVQSYGFADALADQKAAGGGAVPPARPQRSHSAGPLDRRNAALSAAAPVTRSSTCSVRPRRDRVITGSANLSIAAFEGREHEITVALDGEPAWRMFDSYYQRDWQESVPVEPDALLSVKPDGEPASRDRPLALEEVPIVRVLKAGLALVDEAPRRAPAGFAAEVLRCAAALGAELKDCALRPLERRQDAAGLIGPPPVAAGRAHRAARRPSPPLGRKVDTGDLAGRIPRRGAKRQGKALPHSGKSADPGLFRRSCRPATRNRHRSLDR